MIRVIQQPEPTSFNTAVRIPGTRFLKSLGRAPNKKEWGSNNYWKSSLPDLKASYKDICAYTCCWLPDSSSVDHFIPKATNLALAYEWSNFRLASAKVNSKKGSLVTLDPFTVNDNWFTIDFASSRLRPVATESVANKNSIENTIQVLGLNEDSWIRVRFTVLRTYSRGLVNFIYLEEFYPFIARELTRQGLRESILGTVP